MGLYSIAIRNAEAAAKIPAILKAHGYNVRLTCENDRAHFYACPGTRHELTFSITKESQARFSIGVGREGTAVVRILGEHGTFAPSD